MENKYYIRYHSSPLVLDFLIKTSNTFLPLTPHLYCQLLLGWLHQYFFMHLYYLSLLSPAQTSCQ